jgi:arylformamidase
MKPGFTIIDISQPIAASTGCFPGDTPFSRQVTVDYADSGVINLCAFTMSPHVGTHADSPIHIQGHMAHPGPQSQTVGQLPLTPFVGPVAIVDVSPWDRDITWEQVESQLLAWPEFPRRVLFKTQAHNHYERFQPPYAWLDAQLVEELSDRGVCLVGLDTPSVDFVESKTLDTHHALLKAGMSWLENLDLTEAAQQRASAKMPFLIALPLKLMELEASPVRAVLLINGPPPSGH